MPTVAAALVNPVVRQFDLRAAWVRVARNGGAPGVDGVDAQRFAAEKDERLGALEHKLAGGGYRPDALRALRIEKAGKTPRNLLLPSVEDRVVQTAVHGHLLRTLEGCFDAASFAYRPGLGVNGALAAVAAWRDTGRVVVARADVHQFFDRISHLRLDAAVRAMVTDPLVASWIQAWCASPVWDGQGLWTRDGGLPQGAPISPWLANLYLDAFDRTIRSAGIAMVRYADDFVLLARTPAEVASSLDVARDALNALGLGLNPCKTMVTSFERGFRFLGAAFKGAEILVPFRHGTKPSSDVWLAPPMPPTLLRAWRAGVYQPSVAVVSEKARCA